jgi:hypothetical protein
MDSISNENGAPFVLSAPLVIRHSAFVIRRCPGEKTGRHFHHRR